MPLLPGAPIPDPGVVQRAAATQAAEENRLPVDLVERHRRTLSRSWVGGQALTVRPGTAVEGPGVIEQNLAGQPAEEDHVVALDVIRHRRRPPPQGEGGR